MASAAVAAFGTLLKLGDGGGSEVFTTIAEVKDITGPSLTGNPIDVTSHDSPSAVMEFIAGLKDGGTITFTVNFLSSNATQSYAAGLLKDWWNRTKRNFQLVFPYASPITWTIPALVTQFTPSEPVAGALTASVSLKVAGAPTLA